MTSINVANRTLVSFLTNLESNAIEFIPNNSNNLVLAADLLEDKIHVLTMGSDCSLTNTGTVTMPAGSQPRNISAFAGGQLALTSNNDGTVSVLSISGSTVTLLTTFSLPGANPGGISTSSVQSILLHPSGTLAYAFQCKAGNIELLAIDA